MTSNVDRAPARTVWHRIAPALYDPFLALGEIRGMAATRRELLRGVSGRTLEIGAGTGRNLPAYPAEVSIVLTEPDAGMRAVLNRRVHRSGRSVEVLDASADALPVPDASVDTVVSTLVLCTVERPELAVAEIRRVLAPGGRLLFIEHVLSADPRTAARQDRYERLWRAFAVGCRCNLRTLDLLRTQFPVVRHRSSIWRGMPSIVGPLVVGDASR